MKRIIAPLALFALVIMVLSTAVVFAASDGGFVHGIVFEVDGEEYYFAGAPVGPGPITDIPGHDWNRAGKRQFVGKHYNTGPFGEPQWWSSDAPDGELLFVVHGILDEWTPEKAESYATRGYVHYHEIISLKTGEEHPKLVV